MQEEYQNPSLQNQAQDRQVPLDVGSGVPAGSQSNVNPNGEKKGLVSKILSVFEVGLFEIIFVTVTLCLFFFILNYFNLISLSQIYPRELGWLPHRPYSYSTYPVYRKTPSVSPIPNSFQPPALAKIPISKSLLENPIVYEWLGDVKGTLVKKTDRPFTITDAQGHVRKQIEQTFTLSDGKGHTITITDRMPSGDIFNTLFYMGNKDNGPANVPFYAKPIPLSSIPIGSTLEGRFFIFTHGKNASDTLIGSNFTVLSK
ncbi:MAG: hypothetical protein M1289_02840 [Patescibacteria group bacterium]|nr:hypothetical protein [Patescibacteria group bacterium]